MRIAFLSVSSRLGGSEVMLLQVMRALRAARETWALHLVAPAEGPLTARAEALGAVVGIVPMPGPLLRLGEWAHGRRRLVPLARQAARAALRMPAYRRALSAALARIAPDVIHSNGFKAHIMAARARQGGTALVWHMHEYAATRPLTRALLRRHARRADLIVANSASVAEDVRRMTGPVPRVRVIHNAVDLSRFTSSGARADLDALAGLPPAPAGTVRVGLIAAFSRWKGHETFLRAVAALRDATDVRAYIIGDALYDTDGSQYSAGELRSMAEGMGLSGHVGFTGFVEAPETAMRALDVVVHASTEPEPFGLVIAESMACGRAVVTSGTGGAAELVRDGDDALVHRPGDAADLSRCLARLASDPALRARLGSAARARAVAAFDASRLSRDFAEAYDDALMVRRTR